MISFRPVAVVMLQSSFMRCKWFNLKLFPVYAFFHTLSYWSGPWSMSRRLFRFDTFRQKQRKLVNFTFKQRDLISLTVLDLITFTWRIHVRNVIVIQSELKFYAIFSDVVKIWKDLKILGHFFEKLDKLFTHFSIVLFSSGLRIEKKLLAT